MEIFCFFIPIPTDFIEIGRQKQRQRNHLKCCATTNLLKALGDKLLQLISTAQLSQDLTLLLFITSSNGAKQCFGGIWSLVQYIVSIASILSICLLIRRSHILSILLLAFQILCSISQNPFCDYKSTCRMATPAEIEAILNGPSLVPPAGLMPNFVNPSNLNTLSIVTLTVFLSLALIAFSMRIYTKLLILHNFAKEDCESTICYTFTKG